MGFARESTINGFSLAAENSEFLPAEARLNDDKTITIWNEKIKRPEHIRYGFEDCPKLNLRNLFGFPVSPFRTSLNP